MNILQKTTSTTLLGLFGILGLLCMLSIFSWTKLEAQSDPVYLEKYTLTKIYFEGADELNRYYIFLHLQFKEGDTYSPAQLQRKIADTRRALRTQWYFQAEFDPRYYSDGRAEVFVILKPSFRRLGFMGGTADEHSLYIGFLGERKSPGSAFRFHIGKTTGASWYFPYIANSFFGINLLVETQTQRFLERIDVNDTTNVTFWSHGGIEEFIQPAIGIKFGFAQEYWNTFRFLNTEIEHEAVLSVIADLNGLYLLKSRFWAMHFYFRADAGVINGPLLLRSKYKLALLPTRWLELNLNLYATANLLNRLNIGPLNAEVPSIDIENSTHDFNALGRLRTTFLLSHNDYDDRRTQFNLGFAVEGKFGLFGGFFDNQNLQAVQIGAEVQGGVVVDVLTPGSFTTRFLFMLGFNVLTARPVTEFLVEARF